MAFHATPQKSFVPTVENCLAIDTVLLRREGMLDEAFDHHLIRKWRVGQAMAGDLVISTIFTGGIAYPFLHIQGEVFGKRVRQTVRLVSKRMRFGGKRWYFVCPSTKRLCSKLILPPSGDLFASVKASGMAYRSQRDDALIRAQKALNRLQRASSELPPRARRSTREKLMRRIAAKEAFLDRVEERCNWDLARGRRFSLRRAAKS
jgi:hypothetical protein